MNKELLVKVLEFLKEEPELRDMTLREIEERFYSFEHLIISLVEEFLQDKAGEHGTLTTWWLYDNADKKIYHTDKTGGYFIDVESAESFVNFMIESSEKTK